MSVEAKILVEQANTAFYRALESGILDRMDEIWAHEDWVRCVHPGWELLIGWHRVRESWEMIFASGQKMRATPSDVWVYTEGDVAWVTCTENITVFNESSFDSAFASATNLFIHRDGRWLMAHHHASPIPLVVADSSSDTIQ
jgi:ketosteroid isomerase-like protein